jgi:hypothetical protein
MSHIYWVPRQNKLEIPKDKDEVNKQDIHVDPSHGPGLPTHPTQSGVYYESIDKTRTTDQYVSVGVMKH